nr:hypothetical protein [uncultured Chryseobacterium sp.]
MKLRFFEMAVFTVIIVKIFIMGITTTVSSFCEFYKYSRPGIMDIFAFDNKYDTTLTTYTGFDTGYGFFAPNVSSNFIIMSKSMTGNKTYFSDDLLTTTEGKSRFLSVNNIFLKNIEDDKQKIRINHVILKQINKYFESKYDEKFETYTFLYDYPTLKDGNLYPTGRLIKIDSIK